MNCVVQISIQNMKQNMQIRKYRKSTAVAHGQEEEGIAKEASLAAMSFGFFRFFCCFSFVFFCCCCLCFSLCIWLCFYDGQPQSARIRVVIFAVVFVLMVLFAVMVLPFLTMVLLWSCVVVLVLMMIFFFFWLLTSHVLLGSVLFVVLPFSSCFCWFFWWYMALSHVVSIVARVVGVCFLLFLTPCLSSFEICLSLQQSKYWMLCQTRK